MRTSGGRPCALHAVIGPECSGRSGRLWQAADATANVQALKQEVEAYQSEIESISSAFEEIQEQNSRLLLVRPPRALRSTA